MFTKVKVLKILSPISIIALVLYIVVVFSTPLVMFFPFAIANTLGYVWLIIGLSKQRSWAWGILFIIVLATVLFMVLFLVIGGPEVHINAIEWFASLFFWMSLFIFPVFGISAIVRRIRRR